MSDEKKTKRQKFKEMLTKRNIVIGILVVLFVVQYFQMQSLFGTFSFLQGRDSSLITEIGQIKEAYGEFSGDLNEVRDYLRLPTKSYTGFNDAADIEDGDDENKDEVQLALFKYVDFLAKEKNSEKLILANRTILDEVLKSVPFNQMIEDSGWSIQNDENSESASILNENEEVFVKIVIDKETGKVFANTVIAELEITAKNAEDFEKQLAEFLTSQTSRIEEAGQWLTRLEGELKTVMESEDFLALKVNVLGEESGADESKNNLSKRYEVTNVNDDPIGEIVFDPVETVVTLLDKNNPDMSVQVEELKSSLIPFLSKLDTKTLLEKKYSESLAGVKNTLGDNGFKLLLEQAGIKVSEEPREDELRIYFDFVDDGGKVLSSVAIEKSTGVINIVDPDGNNPQNLLLFDPEYKKKTLELPEYVPNYGDETLSSDSTMNILIAGKHGALVDTMIIAHIDDTRRDIRMVSLPRDLFYQGRKINAYAHYYGMPELAKELSKITGYEIDKYILIDMYAFIDVIDSIGGIDITLDQAVIDPTYRVVDDGVEGTLHYEPGDYHLSGVEALRLARTRHTSSDFARAKRQQLILEAIQTKARNFGFGDADTIYEIAKSVLKQTETDIELEEAIAYYFRYQNYEISSMDVMSSGNVLYVPEYTTVENCATMKEEAAASGEPDPGCDNVNHAYTLAPRNNDWNVIKWFFREQFEGE